MSIGNPPMPMHGRRSFNMTTEDWQNLASAYDTWNDRLDCCEEIDPDLKEFVKEVFDSYGLWNHNEDEPNLSQYRTIIMQLC